jgi:membrane protein
MTMLFAMMFKLLPDTVVAWRDIWMGALITAALFTVGKLLIGLYLGKSAIGSAYGAAGSLDPVTKVVSLAERRFVTSRIRG